MSDEFARLRAFANQRIGPYVDLDMDINALLSRYEAVEAEIKALRAALEPFARLASFEGWDTTAQTLSQTVYANDNGVLTRGDFQRAAEALKAKEGQG